LPVKGPAASRNSSNPGAKNQIPRRGGAFYWQQVYNAVNAGATMLYGAMFDEVDEGTAILKACPKQSLAPQDWWLTLDADGYDLPSDWYLRLAGLANKMLNKEIALSKEMPINPQDPDTGWVEVSRDPITVKGEKNIFVHHNALTITLSSEQIVNVIISKANGEIVMSHKSKNAQKTLRLPLHSMMEMSNGVYFLRVTAGKQTYSKPLVLLSGRIQD
jgi:hypothetical protein